MSDIDYTNAVIKKIEDIGIEYTVRDTDDNNKLITLYHYSKVVPVINARIIIEDGAYIKILSTLARSVPEDKRPAIIEVLNKLTLDYRYIRYSLDKDGDIIVDYDFVLYGDEEESATHLVSRVFVAFDIFEDALKKILPVLLSEKISSTTDDYDLEYLMKRMNKLKKQFNALMHRNNEPAYEDVDDDDDSDGEE